MAGKFESNKSTARGAGSHREDTGRPARLYVGSRVIARYSADPAVPVDRWPPAAGVVVDDFGDTLAAGREYGRDWAITRRWAVALDAGPLIFRDDEDLEHES